MGSIMDTYRHTYMIWACLKITDPLDIMDLLVENGRLQTIGVWGAIFWSATVHFFGCNLNSVRTLKILHAGRVTIFLENTRHEGSIWFLQDIVKVFANIPSTIPQPFPKRSGKSPLMWGSCYCHPHAAGALGEGHLLESEMVSGGRHPFSNRWCSYPHFLAMKINRDNVPVFVAGGQKIPEHLQFRVPKTTWGADPVPIGYVSIQGSISSLLRISIYPLVN